MRPMLVLFVACAAAAPAADHMLVIEDSTDVTFEAALGVMTKFGIDRKTAETILHHLDEKGAAVAAQGPKEACERLAKEFSEIGVKSSVRPNAYSPDLVPDNSEYAESDVEELSVTRLNELMKSDAGLLVVFYGTACVHCKALIPEYKKAASELKADGLAVGAVNLNGVGGGQQLAHQLSVTVLPTIRYVFDGNHLEFGGERKADAIVEFARACKKKQLGVGGESEGGDAAEGGSSAKDEPKDSKQEQQQPPAPADEAAAAAAKEASPGEKAAAAKESSSGEKEAGAPDEQASTKQEAGESSAPSKPVETAGEAAATAEVSGEAAAGKSKIGMSKLRPAAAAAAA